MFEITTIFLVIFYMSIEDIICGIWYRLNGHRGFAGWRESETSNFRWLWRIWLNLNAGTGFVLIDGTSCSWLFGIYIFHDIKLGKIARSWCCSTLAMVIYIFGEWIKIESYQRVHRFFQPHPIPNGERSKYFIFRFHVYILFV